MTPEKVEGIVISVGLIGVLAMIYRSKMAYEAPQGSCLFLFRFVFACLFISFASVAVLCVSPVEKVQNFLGYATLTGFISAGIGMVLSSFFSCGKAKG